MADLELNRIRSSQINEKVLVDVDGKYTDKADEGVVKYDVILPETRADLVKETFGAKADRWKAQTPYVVGATVYVEDASGAIASYECVKAHTSGNSFSNQDGEWRLILSRRFVRPDDEILWRDGGSALKFKGLYSSVEKYRKHDVVALRNTETNQEEYFVSLKDNNQNIAPSFTEHNDNWRNLNLWATHAVDADKIKIQSAPALSDEKDSVYLTFVTTPNKEDASLYTEAQLVYEVNSKYLHAMSEYADKYMKSFNSDGETVEPEARSINDEFKAIYAAIKTISGGELVLGHGLTIKLNGETLLDNWMAAEDGNINISLDHSDITDWDSTVNAAITEKGDARYVRYDGAQTLSDDEKAQARFNINAAPAGNYPVMDNNNKILLENLPDTVVGGLQYKGVYDASVAGTIQPEMGDYYIVSVAGNYDPAGGVHAVVNNELTFFRIGDWAIYNGAAEGWAKIDNTDAVKTVNGQIGAVQTYKGVYSEEAEYFAGDWVLNNGILYLAVQNSKGQSIEEAAYWQVAGRIYTGEKGIKVDGNVISHTNTLERKDELNPEAIDVNGGQFSVDINEYDEEGHVISTQKQNITLKQSWREVKVGGTTVIAGNDNAALNIVGNNPIEVAADAAADTVYVKHAKGTAVSDKIELKVGDDGLVDADIVSSDEFGHVNGTRKLKLSNLAVVEGTQTLIGAKSFGNKNGSGSVILPAATNVYNIGSEEVKFAGIYATDMYATNFNGALKGNADTATNLLKDFQIKVSINNGVKTESASQKTNGANNVELALDLPNSGVSAGTWCAVTVNEKGIVTHGAHVIEFAKNIEQKNPSASLVTGGLFFRMVESEVEDKE